MDIRIKTTDYEMVPAVEAYLDEKLAVIAKHLGSDDDSTRCEVEIGRAAGGQRHGDNMWFAEFNVSTPGGASVRATNNADSVNTAIEDAKEEILRQLRTEKQIHRRMLRQSGAAIKRLLRLNN